MCPKVKRNLITVLLNLKNKIKKLIVSLYLVKKTHPGYTGKYFNVIFIYQSVVWHASCPQA